MAEGWKNVVLDAVDRLDEDVEALSNDRMEICKECPSNVLNICTECGCPLTAKTKSPMETCPLNKWNPRIYDYSASDSCDTHLFINIGEIPAILRQKFIDITGFEDGETVSLKYWEDFLESL